MNDRSEGDLLVLALINKRKHVAENIVKYSSYDINYTDDEDASLNALIYACEKGILKLVKFLLAHGADVNLLVGFYKGYGEGNDIDQFTATPLTSACRCGHFEVVKMLIKRGANVNQLNGSAITAAALGNHVDIVKCLIKNRADVNASGGPNPSTALVAAATKGHAEMVRILVVNGADPDLACAHSEAFPYRTALEAARAISRVDIEQILLDPGYNVKRARDLSLLSLCASDLPNISSAEAKLKLGADPKAVDNEQVPALSLCCSRAIPSQELVELMLVYGADPNQPDSKGRTALHHLLLNGPLDEQFDLAFTLIVYYRADVTRADAEGRTALDLARGCPKLLKLCEKYKDFYQITSTSLK